MLFALVTFTSATPNPAMSSRPAPCGNATCGNQGCLDIYSADHHHIITSSSASSLIITYGEGDTLGGSHPRSPWTCECTKASCPRLVGSFTCDADFYGSTWRVWGRGRGRLLALALTLSNPLTLNG